jgi:glycyl-tRNA synthetase
LAKEVKGVLEGETDLLAEVANLVEKPTALRGEFETKFLALPMPVLISVMKKHQRYFPVEREGALLPYFIAVRNGGEEHLDIVTRGNEQVIRARFADADYFFRRDLEKPLEEYLPRLSTLIFQADLGSMLDKTDRIERLAEMLAETLELKTKERNTAARAAHLAKADLATLMVIEMTSLQGEIGGEYALRSGESAEVAQAIREHYLPRFQGDRMPVSNPGYIVGMADRLDSLMGLFAAGIQPSGASDPFAMRRAAIGLVQLLISRQIRFDLDEGLMMAAGGLPLEASQEHRKSCLDFIVARLQILLRSEGAAHDAVDAVLAAQGRDPAGAAAAVAELDQYRQRKDWDEILQAYARCVRITRDLDVIYSVDTKNLIESAETSLFDGLQAAEKKSRKSGSVGDFFEAFIPMIPEITSFFDEVLVMADDEQLRCNRLGLLQRIVALADGVLDLSKLEGF